MSSGRRRCVVRRDFGHRDIVQDALTHARSCPHSHALRRWMVGAMAQKKRAGGRKLIRVDEGILRLAVAELVRRTTASALALGTVKLSGFGSRDAVRHPPSRAKATRRPARRGPGQHG